MMTGTVKNTKLSTMAEVLCEKGMEGLGSAIEILVNEAMCIERERYLNASHYERTPARQGYANGFKPKQLKTRVGELNLLVPQVREGDFYPSFLEKGLRSERALKLSLAEMYIQGVSTRKVSAILEELCGLEVSSAEVSRAAKLLDEEFAQWRNRRLGQYEYLILDARYEKVREGGCVMDSAVLVAYGINPEGKREILGVSVSLSEAEIHWRHFLESLVTRGLHGLISITSDAHAGLKAALRTVFPSILWQRCQFHLQQNAQSYVPKESMKKEVAQDIRYIFNAPNQEEAERFLKIAITKYEKIAPRLSQWMEANIPEGLGVFQLKQSHRRRLRTSNLAERVNREIKRRTQVASIFPSAASCERLVTGVLIEISEEWGGGKTYLNVDDYE
jgi:transposase-like protein